MTGPRLVLLLCLGLVLGLTLPAPPSAEAVDQEAWEADLDQLKKSMKKSATTHDLQQYLGAVAGNYKSAKGPPKPPEGADPAEIKQWESDTKKFNKWLDKYRSDAVKLFVKAMTLVKIQNGRNVRVEANIQAAKILGDLPLPPPGDDASEEEKKAWESRDKKFRKDLSKDIMKTIEKKLTKVKTHDVSTDLLDAAFEALGKLNDEGALLWMAKEYSHTIDTKKEYLVAAHKAMVLFKDVRGKIRYDIVSEFIKQYAGVELQAEKSDPSAAIQAKKRFWDFIKTYTIPVVQYFAGKPVDEEDQALAEMKQFQRWMRDHKNPRKAPWTDE
jgi:hypothetical protein